MKTSNEIPPILAEIKKHFFVDWEAGIAIAYGDTVYAKYDLLPDVAVHEAVHLEQQQELGPEAWWKQYLTDPEFRFEQEVSAYREQMRFLKVNCPNRNALYSRKHALALDLSGLMYGELCTYSRAMRLLSV